MAAAAPLSFLNIKLEPLVSLLVFNKVKLGELAEPLVMLKLATEFVIVVLVIFCTVVLSATILIWLTVPKSILVCASSPNTKSVASIEFIPVCAASILRVALPLVAPPFKPVPATTAVISPLPPPLAASSQATPLPVDVNT